MKSVCKAITASLLICAGLPAQEAPQQTLTASVLADPKATGEWLASLFTVQNNQILVAGKTPDIFPEARLKFSRPTEIQTYKNKIIADQEGMYPLIIGPDDDGYSVEMYTPFYAFLDDIIGPDGLPAYSNHPKEESMTLAGFRKIAECLHAHLTQATGALPEHHRVIDEITYPSEHYIWTVGKHFVILTAYDGNDSDGISLTITSKLSEVEGLRKMRPTTEKIFTDWGDPLPHLKGIPKK